MADDRDGKGSLEGPQVFRSLYLHLNEAVALHEIICDEAGEPINYRILDVNPQFRRYTGLELGQVVGKLATEAFGTLHPPYLREYGQVALGGQPIRFESFFAPLDRYYEISVAPFSPGLFATIFLDVSERKRNEKALRESEWFLRKSQRVGRIGSYRFHAATGIWISSEALDEVFGIGPEFVRDVGGWLSLAHADDRDGLHNYLSEYVVRGGHPFDRRYRIVRANDGEVRWVHGLGELEKDSNGQTLFMIGTIQDVTDLENRERALRASEEKSRRIFDLVPSPLAVTEVDGTLLDCNEAFCTALGWARSDLMGKSVDAFWNWEDPSQRVTMYSDLGRGASVDGLECKMRRSDGQLRTMQISARPFALDGRIVFLSAARDVSEQRKLEQQMLQSQKLESLGVLAGGIAHDFNNLLTGILGNADLAKTEMSPLAPSRASLESIEVAARRAADLCRQLLAYSGRGKFVIQPLGLQELVEEMAHLLSISISKKVELKYHFAQGIPAVDADATQLRQVIMNLIVNASEAIGDRSGEILLSTGIIHCDANALLGCLMADGVEPGDFVYLEVADTGHGMDKATLDRVFDPFFSTKFTGRGLGLAAVLGIVRGHRGAIQVASEPGRGTTFRLLFPSSVDSARRVQPKAQVISAFHAKGKILFADDEETIRNLGRRMLQRVGFEVVLAEDGRQAVAKFVEERGAFHLVILDLTMPHLDGEACYSELRQISPDVKVILSSGYNEQDVVNRFAGKGLAGFIQKPYTAAELIAKISEVLRQA